MVATLSKIELRGAGMLFRISRNLFGRRNNNNLSGFFFLQKVHFFCGNLNYFCSCSVHVILSNASALDHD